MKTYRIRANRTYIPKGAYGGKNSHKKIADANDSTYVTVSSNKKGLPAQASPEWWFEQPMPKGKILRVRMGVRVENRGVVGGAYMRFASASKLGIDSSPVALPSASQMPAMARYPKSFFTPWAEKPWGLKRDWLPSDLEKFLVRPTCRKWKGKSSKKALASANSLGSARIISVTVYVEYASAATSAPYDIKPANGASEENPRPYLEAKVRKHKDGIKQRVQFDILGKDANGKFTQVLATRYSHPVTSGTTYGYYGGSGGFPATSYAHPQGVYQVRARTVTDVLTNPGPWSKPQAFTVKHKPKVMEMSPSANQTLGWTTNRIFKWKFQDPWTNDRMSKYRIQVLNSSTNAVLVDTDWKTNATLLSVTKPTKANSRSYTAPANVTYQATVPMPLAAKGVPLKWRMTVHDEEGASSGWSSYIPFAMADNPTISIDQPYAEPDNGSPLFSLTVVEPDPVTVAKTIDITVKEKKKGTVVYQAQIAVGEKKLGINPIVIDGPLYPTIPIGPAEPVIRPIVLTPYAAIKGTSAVEKFTSLYKSDGVYSFQPRRNFMVNETDYVITAKVTATNSLTGSKSKNVKALFSHPTPVTYDVDYSRLDIDGGVHLDWSQAVADEDFNSWKVYRMVDGEGWVLLYETDNEFTRSYVDFMFLNGLDYMYTVTQTAERDGSILESPLGYRGVPTDDRTNLSENPGFEFDTTGWSTLFATTLTRRAVNWGIDDAPTGMPQERLTYTNSAGQINMLLHRVVLPVDNPSHIFGSVMVHVPQASRYAGLSVSFVDEAGTVVPGGADGVMTEMDRYAWVQTTLPPTAVPANAYAAIFGISVYADEEGTETVPANTEVNVAAFLADAANDLELPNYEFFDGDSISALWSGTRGVSTSVLVDNAVPETEMTRVNSPLFLLIDMDDIDEPRAVAMRVNQHDYKENIQREVSDIMERGRHVNLGTRLGYEGSFTAQLRGVDGEPTLQKNVLNEFYLTSNVLYLRSTYDMLIRVSIDAPDINELPGTGESQMLDVSVSYVEVYADEEGGSISPFRTELQ